MQEDDAGKPTPTQQPPWGYGPTSRETEIIRLAHQLNRLLIEARRLREEGSSGGKPPQLTAQPNLPLNGIGDQTTPQTEPAAGFTGLPATLSQQNPSRPVGASVLARPSPSAKRCAELAKAFHAAQPTGKASPSEPPEPESQA